MFKCTIGDFMDKSIYKIKNQWTESYKMYVISDDDTVFYVGIGKDVIERVFKHIGFNKYGEIHIGIGSLGMFIQANLPQSNLFTVTMYTACEALSIATNTNGLPEYAQNGQCFAHIDYAEESMIKSLSPCFNDHHNDCPSVIPDKYIDPEISNIDRRTPGDIYGDMSWLFE